MQGIDEAGFTNCTPIQAQTLPVALAGRDVAGQAQTGTGKTAAFLVALYQSLLTRPPAANRSPTSIRALIVAPTRELAVQIHHDAEILGAHTGLKQRWCSAASTTRSSARQLGDGCDVLIGTPGRLIDYFKQHVFDLRHAQVLVLDEADRMFDLGFIADIRYILRRLPPPGAAPVDAVLGHALAAGAGARLRAHEQPRAGAHRAGQGDGRPRAPGHLLPLDGGEGAAAHRAAAPDRGASAPWCS